MSDSKPLRQPEAGLRPGKPASKPVKAGALGNRNARKHGLSVLKRARRELGSRMIERTVAGKAIRDRKAAYIADLGGIENVSTAELAELEEAGVTKFILGIVNAWIIENADRIVSGRTRGLAAVVRDRNALVATLKGLLESLGLKRRAREASLADYMASKGKEATS